MPILTVDQFKIGIDRRKGKEVSDANRLRVAENIIINNGGAIEKRGGMRHHGQANTTSRGLASGFSHLATFSVNGVGGVQASSHDSSIFIVDNPLIIDDVTPSGAWTAATAYALDTVITAAAGAHAGLRFRVVDVQGTGTSHATTEPVWTTDLDDEIIDNAGANQITWRTEYVKHPLEFQAVDKIWYATPLANYWAVIAHDDAASSDEPRRRLFYIDRRTKQGTTVINDVGTITASASGVYVRWTGSIAVAGTPYGTLTIDRVDRDTTVGQERLRIRVDDKILPDNPVGLPFHSIKIGATTITADQFSLSYDPAPGAATKSEWSVPGDYSTELPDGVATDFDIFVADALPNEVTDPECPLNADNRTPAELPPLSPACIKLAERLFIPERELVKFCELSIPRDWTDITAKTGAGFLAVGRQASGDDDCLAVGQYQGKLITTFEDASQSWIIDADSDFNAFDQSVEGVGCRYPRAISNLSGDTFMLSNQGFRSISLLSLTNNLADVDVGTAIEDLVRAKVAAITDDPIGLFNAKTGQFQCYLEDEAFVYTFSRTAKISAWSQYKLPVTVTDACQFQGEAYVRDSNSNVYNFDDTLYVDEAADASGNPLDTDIDVLVEMAYLDFKKPGELKYIHSCDLVVDGTCDISFKYEYYDDNGALQTGQTEKMTVSSNTRPGELLPVEVCAVSISPVFESNASTTNLRIDAINFQFTVLGAVA